MKYVFFFVILPHENKNLCAINSTYDTCFVS